MQALDKSGDTSSQPEKLIFETPKNFRKKLLIALVVFLTGAFGGLAYVFVDQYMQNGFAFFHLLLGLNAILVLLIYYSVLTNILLAKQRVIVSGDHITERHKSICFVNITSITHSFWRHSMIIQTHSERIEISKHLREFERFVQILEERTSLLGVKTGHKTSVSIYCGFVFRLMGISLSLFSALITPVFFEELSVFLAILSCIGMVIAIWILSFLCSLDMYRKYIFQEQYLVEYTITGHKTVYYKTIDAVVLDTYKSVIHLEFADKGRIRIYATRDVSLEEMYHYLIQWHKVSKALEK